jgi:two-component system response regulator FixJ
MTKEGIRIHLIDHDTATLLYLFEELTRAGFHVNASSASLRALDCIAETKPQVLLCNLHMPEIEGLEILEKVRRSSPETSVIFMSSCGDWAVHEEVIQRGAKDLVPKPLTAKVLLRAVERVLEPTPAGSVHALRPG